MKRILAIAVASTATALGTLVGTQTPAAAALRTPAVPAPSVVLCHLRAYTPQMEGAWYVRGPGARAFCPTYTLGSPIRLTCTLSMRTRVVRLGPDEWRGLVTHVSRGTGGELGCRPRWQCENHGQIYTVRIHATAVMRPKAGVQGGQQRLQHDSGHKTFVCGAQF